MSDTTPTVFVRQELVPERPAPIKTTGFIGFLRTRLFNSPTNILITIVCALLLWFIVVPAIRFMLIDAVWTGKDRTACLAKTPNDVVGACWPFIQAKFSQFIYGFYPEPERWRVNIVFLLGAILLLPLLIPRLPAKGLNAGLFFIAFPVVAFFLLYGGGLKGLGVSWTAGLLSGFNDSIGDGGRKLVTSGETTAVIGPLLWVLGKLLVLLSTVVSWVLFPLTWLRDQIQAFGRPVWADLVLTAIIVSGLLFWLGGGMRAGLAAAGQLPGDLCRHRHRHRRHGARPRRIARRRYAAVGRLAGDAGGGGHRHRRLDAGRHCAGARPALDHSADPDLLDRLHRVLARRSADHGAVLRDLHVAAVRSDRLHHRRIDARPDRDRAVYRRLPGRKHPRRPCRRSRAGRARRRARSACPGPRPRRWS